MIVGDEPVVGYYAARLTRGGPFVAVKITKEPTGYNAEVDGRSHCDIDSVWPACARNPISKGEYDFLRVRAIWARDNHPEQPVANPRRRVDLRRVPPVKP
jgi:hypothetical protein